MNLELLAPAGSWESMNAAFSAGADAVYIGGERFGARAYADNLNEEQMKRAIDTAHLLGKKLYLTVNTLLKDSEMEEVYGYLNPFYQEGLDAVIVQDTGLLRYIRDVFPGLPIHASTQMGITGKDGALFLQNLGASRVVTARELSLKEIARIHEHTDIEIESFVHGALCVSYSGQCLFSSMIGGRSGNRGRCAQPCRLPYELYDGTERIAAESGRYLLSPKDICTLDILPALIESGISSFKIEGRMKRPEYTAGVTRIYRRCIDRFLTSGKNGRQVFEAEKDELLDLYNRGGFSEGYYRQHNGPQMMSRERPNHQGLAAAKVCGAGKGRIFLRAMRDLNTGDILEYDGQKKTHEVTVKQEVKKGGEYTVQFFGKTPEVRKDSVFWRTHNEALLDELHRSCVCHENLQKINGKLILSRQKSAILTVCMGNYSITEYGEKPQLAVSRPLSREDVKKQLKKTGGSGFVFDSLQIEMEDDLFLPVQSLNDLRRRSLEKLRETILASFFREEGSFRSLAEMPAGQGEMELTVSLECLDSLEDLCRISEIRTILIDCSAFVHQRDFLKRSPEVIDLCRRAEKKCCYIMPWIFRSEAREYYENEEALKTLKRYDGIFLRNLEEYWFLKEQAAGSVLYADWNLYTLNNEARKFWQEAGVLRDTVSPELNRREIARRGCYGSDLIVYGYQPLMVSAQCQRKNALGCTGKPGILYLKDRKQKLFAVKNYCPFCYNVIYNSTPLELDGSVQGIRRLCPSAIRLQFTSESPEDTEATVRRYIKAFFEGGEDTEKRKDFTRGHFERGVE
ncbi:MAG: U32 family peptidase [Eubacteriales bacterium]|nr:U32 family peptidase [Eubacteriales bacterium]